MKTNSRFLLAAAFGLALAFTLSCSDNDGGNNGNNGSSKSSCIKAELEIKANTLDDVAKSCDAIRSDVLSQLPNSIGSCSKNELDFDIPIKDIMKDCGVDEIPIINPSSSSNGGSNQGTPDAYTLVSYNSNSFTYYYMGESYRCTDGGILEKDTHDETETMGYSMYYSNGNHILALGRCTSWSGMNGITNCTGFSDTDTIHFKGTSSNLIDTWTRTKDKNTSCKLNTWTSCIDYDRDKCECREYKEHSDIVCKGNWDYTKLVFTQNTVAITRDYCRTDYMIDGKVGYDGRKYKIISCDTYEVSKGAEKITIKYNRGINWETEERTYNGKTCKLSETSVSQRAKACSDAWKAGNSGGKLEYAYYDILNEYYKKCLVDNKFPEWIDWDDGRVEPSPSDCRGDGNGNNSGNGNYCYGYSTYRDCNLIGGKWISSEQHCLSGGGILVNADYCISNGIGIDNTP